MHMEEEENRQPFNLSNLPKTHKMIAWNILSNAPNNNDEKKVVNVFLGGQGGVQVNPFKTAWQNLNISMNWTVNYVSVGFINDMKWSPKNLVDWLLNCDIHIILSHVHQGIADFLKWCMIDLEYQLQRLKFHLGFPNLDKLKCPVFLQDKYKYLKNLPVQKINNTLQLYLTDDLSYYSFENTSFIDRIKRLNILIAIYICTLLYNIKSLKRFQVSYRKMMRAVDGLLKLLIQPTAITFDIPKHLIQP